MIQIDERDLNALIDIAGRAVKSQAEARLLEILTARWNAQVEAMRKAREMQKGNDNAI